MLIYQNGYVSDENCTIYDPFPTIKENKMKNPDDEIADNDGTAAPDEEPTTESDGDEISDNDGTG